MERLGRWLLRRVCKSRGHQWRDRWPMGLIKECQRCDAVDDSLLYDGPCGGRNFTPQLVARYGQCIRKPQDVLLDVTKVT